MSGLKNHRPVLPHSLQPTLRGHTRDLLPPSCGRLSRNSPSPDWCQSLGPSFAAGLTAPDLCRLPVARLFVFAGGDPGNCDRAPHGVSRPMFPVWSL